MVGKNKNNILMLLYKCDIHTPLYHNVHSCTLLGFVFTSIIYTTIFINIDMKWY